MFDAEIKALQSNLTLEEIHFKEAKLRKEVCRSIETLTRIWYMIECNGFEGFMQPILPGGNVAWWLLVFMSVKVCIREFGKNI